MKTILTTIAMVLAVSVTQLPASDSSFARVPVGKTYVVYDGKGKRVAEFRSGQKTSMTTNCVMINCPSTFGPDIVCWKCMGLTAQPPSQQSDSDLNHKLQLQLSEANTYARVPTGKTYIVYDGKRKKVAEFRSGQKTSMTTNCAMIKCPSTFGKDVVCWQCMGFTAK